MRWISLFVKSVIFAAALIATVTAVGSPALGGEKGRSSARQVGVSADPLPLAELVELEAKGAIALAILGDGALAVEEIDPFSIRLAGAFPVKLDSGETVRLRDVDGDGHRDLLFHLPRTAVALAEEDLQAVIHARTASGEPIEGTVSLYRPPRGDSAPAPSFPKRNPRRVRIDVRPGEAGKQVDAGLDGVVPVAVLGSDTLDVSRLDVQSLSLSGAPVWRRFTGAPAVSTSDLDGDGRIDLTAWFATKSLALDTGPALAELSARTGDGEMLEGEQGIEATRYETFTIRGGPCSETDPVPQAVINTGAITIPASGAAAPYPSASEVVITDPDDRVVVQVRVTLTGFSHTWPDDVDVLLQGPEGQTVVLMSDAGGSFDTAGAILTFDDSAATLLPDSGLIATGVYRPTDYEPGEVLPAPAPVPSVGGLSVFAGSNPLGSWRLFVADDAGPDAGSIQSWTLDVIVATRFCNRAPIQVPSGGTASPYPSTILVNDFNLEDHVISKVTVTLDGLSHSWPDDIDVLLAGPEGQNVTLLSDAGGGFPGVSGRTLLIDDDAATLVPDSTAPISGHYRPSNYEGAADLFPPAAPPPSGLSELAVFRGTDPLGAWNLYVVDDVVGDAGAVLDGWCLTFTTIVPTVPCTSDFIAIPSSGQAAPYPSTIAVTGLTGVVAEVGATLYAFSHTWPDDVDVLLVGPQAQEVTLLSDAGGSIDAAGLVLSFDRDAAAPLPDPGPLVSGEFLPTNYEGADPFPFPAPPASGGTSLGVFDGTAPNGLWSLYIVDDVTSDSGSVNFGWCLWLTLVVSPTQTCNVGPVTINASGPAAPFPSSLSVSGLSAPVGELRVSLLDYSHAWPDDVDVMLSGPLGQNTLLMSDAGGIAPGVSTIDLVFEDGAGPLPDGAGLGSGTYTPTDYEPGDTFSFPAPLPSGAASLGVFAGTDPNGSWQLWVEDDVAAGAGSIAGGWCLDVLPPVLPPDRVIDLRFTDATTIVWQPTPPDPMSYLVFRGDPPSLPNLLDCSADSILRGAPVAPLLAGVAETPAPGQFYWYLARAQNAAGVGPAGDARIVSEGLVLREQNTLANDCCEHSRCEIGTRLAPGCDPCVEAICAVDPYCCENSWDDLCVSRVATVCGSLVCPAIGTCAHTPCTTGVALVNECDVPPLGSSCVTQVCTADAFCCSTSWDPICVGEVTSVCGLSCM
jgi:subtilisin-like proprotein convertase family protein